MDRERLVKAFETYVERYDLSDPNIYLKYILIFCNFTPDTTFLPVMLYLKFQRYEILLAVKTISYLACCKNTADGISPCITLTIVSFLII